MCSVAHSVSSDKRTMDDNACPHHSFTQSLMALEVLCAPPALCLHGAASANWLPLHVGLPAPPGASTARFSSAPRPPWSARAPVYFPTQPPRGHRWSPGHMCFPHGARGRLC